MLFHTPHSVEVFVPVEAVDGASYRVFGVEYAWSCVLRAQVTPMASSQAFEAIGVDVDRPHLMMWGEEQDVPQGALVSLGARWFLARAGQQVWNAEPLTAHRSIVLAEIDASAVEAAHAVA